MSMSSICRQQEHIAESITVVVKKFESIYKNILFICIFFVNTIIIYWVLTIPDHLQLSLFIKIVYELAISISYDRKVIRTSGT